MKHFLDISKHDSTELLSLIHLAKKLKDEVKAGQFRTDLQNKTLGILFEKPSMRTRVSFELGMKQLGGHVIHLQNSEIGLGKRETVEDVARVLSRYLDAIMIRTFDHDNVVKLAESGSIPIINGLTDYSHPCQAMADFLTLYERFGTLEGLTLTYIGDGNNVCLSLIHLAEALNVTMHVACPESHKPVTDKPYVWFDSAKEAVKGAHAVYTDVWTSMGQEDEYAERLALFSPYQVTSELMQAAREDAIFMHCLPAHREEEVTHEVMESAASAVFDQAENRLHAQKAIILTVLKGES